MENVKWKIMLSLLCILHFNVCNFAQEVVTDLTCNPVVMKEHASRAGLPSYKMAKVTAVPVALPFRDDFSKDGVYPDTAWWQSSSSIFVNRHYPRNPLTIGVATFDGIDSTGYPYNFGASSGSSGLADRLVSKPIDLSAITAADSVYLSFFYQSKGLGNAPEAIDSLMLEFYSPTKKWTRKWVKAGFIPNFTDSGFTRVMVPVNDTAWFKSGFQFRFRNYATLSGNVDHWHIDYVYLDKNRSRNDTVMDDVAFAYHGKALLKVYQAMPWNLYTSSDKAGATVNYIRNNDTAAKITNYLYEVLDQGKNVLFTYNPGTNNLGPFHTSGYSSHLAHSNPPFTYSFPTLTDTTTFMIRHALAASIDDIRENDTMRYIQKFYDYYAYDDGTAEAAYGLNQIGSMLAIRFTMGGTDTLKGIQYYWNPVLNNQSSKGFRPTIWADNGGLPGAIIFQDSVRYPVYDKKGHNYFHMYFTTNSIIKLSGAFFAGWTQVGPDVLNVGIDLNINNQNKIFFNTTGTWQGSLVQGSPMIRPVFKCGKPFYVGVDELTADAGWQLYPNPAQDKLYVKAPDAEVLVSVFDASGRMLLSERPVAGQAVDISMLSRGIYFVRIDGDNRSVTRKLAVVR